VTQTRAESRHRRGDLRIEQRGRARWNDRGQGFEVFAGAVHHAHVVRIGEARGEGRMSVQCRRIDDGDASIDLRLHQREFRVEGVGAHEFGVQADDGRNRLRGKPCVERGFVVYPVVHEDSLFTVASGAQHGLRCAHPHRTCAHPAMPGTEVVSKQAVYGGAAGIALLAFALIYRFYPGDPSVPAAPVPRAESAAVPAMSLTPSTKTTVKTAPAKPAQAATEPPPPATPAVPPTKAIAALLKKAAKAFDEGHLTAPKDVSALAYYQQVLAADKDSAAARAGLEKIHKSLLQQAGDALDRGDERDAASAIGELAQVPEVEEDVSRLQSRLKTLRQVMPLLTRAADLLQQGHAASPPNGNALAVYRQVLKLDADNKLAQQGLVQVQQGFLDRALASAAQDDFDGADKILADASTVSPGSQQLLDT